jgi:hypothetical protein
MDWAIALMANVDASKTKKYDISQKFYRWMGTIGGMRGGQGLLFF